MKINPYPCGNVDIVFLRTPSDLILSSSLPNPRGVSLCGSSLSMLAHHPPVGTQHCLWPYLNGKYTARFYKAVYCERAINHTIKEVW